MKRPRHRPNDREAKRAPQRDRTLIGRHHRVELHAEVAQRTCPRHDVLAQPASDTLPDHACRNHEARVGDVRSETGLVLLELRGAHDLRPGRGHPHLSRCRQHPQFPGLLLRRVPGPGVGLASRNHLVPDRPDLLPVVVLGTAQLHATIVPICARRRPDHQHLGREHHPARPGQRPLCREQGCDRAADQSRRNRARRPRHPRCPCSVPALNPVAGTTPWR